MRAIRRLFGTLALVGIAVAAVVVARRRLAGPSERVDLYYEDGSMSSFDAEAPAAAHLFRLAGDALSAVRGARVQA